ncbi:MAG TPA: hypothetical protein VM925_37795 [Labilithrix sp.]|nr:hypothetical protein [Labilithrix sp.]
MPELRDVSSPASSRRSTRRSRLRISSTSSTPPILHGAQLDVTQEIFAEIGATETPSTLVMNKVHLRAPK